MDCGVPGARQGREVVEKVRFLGFVKVIIGFRFIGAKVESGLLGKEV